MELVIDYGSARYASLVHFDWFDVPWDEFLAEPWRDYEVVTDAFLARLRTRIETQRGRSGGYTQAMRDRLAMAEKLLAELEGGVCDGEKDCPEEDSRQEASGGCA